MDDNSASLFSDRIMPQEDQPASDNCEDWKKEKRRLEDALWTQQSYRDRKASAEAEAKRRVNDLEWAVRDVTRKLEDAQRDLESAHQEWYAADQTVRSTKGRIDQLKELISWYC